MGSRIMTMADSQSDSQTSIAPDELAAAIETLSSRTDGHGDRVSAIADLGQFVSETDRNLPERPFTPKFEMDVFRWGLDPEDVRFGEVAEKVSSRRGVDMTADEIEQELKLAVIGYAAHVEV